MGKEVSVSIIRRWGALSIKKKKEIAQVKRVTLVL